MTDFAEVLHVIGAGEPVVTVFASVLDKACGTFQILTASRQSAFIAQMAHECGMFRRMAENMNYSDPERIVKIFRKAFDFNKDMLISQQELDFAKGFVRDPIKLANRVYANRMGNGDEASGDGWKYRARGIGGLTGKENYSACGAALGLQLLAHPELLEQPENAAMSGAWFWRVNGCNDLADAGLFDDITRKINGGMNGADDRRALWLITRKAMGL